MESGLPSISAELRSVDVATTVSSGINCSRDMVIGARRDLSDHGELVDGRATCDVQRSSQSASGWTAGRWLLRAADVVGAAAAGMLWRVSASSVQLSLQRASVSMPSANYRRRLQPNNRLHTAGRYATHTVVISQLIFRPGNGSPSATNVVISTKAFLFHNRSSSNFAYRLVTTLSTIAPCRIFKLSPN